EQRLAPDAECGRHAGTVLGHVRAIVVRADAAVEACIDALRHAALAGEERVADAGERSKGCGLPGACAHHASNPGSVPIAGAERPSTLKRVPVSVGPPDA